MLSIRTSPNFHCLVKDLACVRQKSSLGLHLLGFVDIKAFVEDKALCARRTGFCFEMLEVMFGKRKTMVSSINLFFFSNFFQDLFSPGSMELRIVQ